MLSTPPAFILSQDQTLALKFVLVKNKHPAYSFPFLPLFRFCSKNSPQAQSKAFRSVANWLCTSHPGKPVCAVRTQFFKEIFGVGIYCSVIKVLPVFPTALIDYHIQPFLSTVFFNFFSSFFAIILEHPSFLFPQSRYSISSQNTPKYIDFFLCLYAPQKFDFSHKKSKY